MVLARQRCDGPLYHRLRLERMHPRIKNNEELMDLATTKLGSWRLTENWWFSTCPDTLPAEATRKVLLRKSFASGANNRLLHVIARTWILWTLVVRLEQTGSWASLTFPVARSFTKERWLERKGFCRFESNFGNVLLRTSFYGLTFTDFYVYSWWRPTDKTCSFIPFFFFFFESV